MHARAFILCITLVVFSGCVYLPQFYQAIPTRAIPPDPKSGIAHLLGPQSEPVSRALLLEEPGPALRSWLHLISVAETSIDLQYFIVQNDATALLFLEHVLQAADRGVRVRALLDDLSTSGLVDSLHALDEHPNVEIRIFNPFNIRVRSVFSFFRLAELAVDGNRLNHRMHNKLFVVDNQVAILGGRNIGDDYFGRSDERNFVDADVLLSGPIVPRLSEGFDSYWNSRWVYPVTALADFPLFPVNLETVRQRITRRLDEREQLVAERRDKDFGEAISRLRGAEAVEWVSMVIDDPDVSWFQLPDEIAKNLTEVALNARREVLVVTPYLVPTAKLLDIAKTLTGRGVKVRVLTNSLSTTDVPLAHAMYSQFRPKIIESGVSLYEMRDRPEPASADVTSEVSLHSKYIVFDDDLVFIGSLNLDRRSLYLNTELGVIVKSRSLVEKLRISFDELTRPEHAWRVISTPGGLRWNSTAGTLDEEPAEGTWQRLRNWFFSLFPLHGQT